MRDGVNKLVEAQSPGEPSLVRKPRNVWVWASALALCLAAQLILLQSMRVTKALPPDRMRPGIGYAFSIKLTPVPGYLEAVGDTLGNIRSTSILREDGVILGPAHSRRENIEKNGMGSFSHWDNYLIFSSKDGTDPRKNGRVYSIEANYNLVAPYRIWVVSALWVVIFATTFVILNTLRIPFRKIWGVTRLFGTNLLLIAVSIASPFLLLEIGLRLHDALYTGATLAPAPRAMSGAPAGTSLATAEPPIAETINIPADIVARAEARHRVLTLPEEWKSRPTHIEGAKFARYWHGVLHVYNDEFFRMNRPIPPKSADVFRVLVVGDSLTYGEGIEEKYRFSNMLQEWLGREFRIEFINLGRDGFQSEDILDVLRRHVPQQSPDLVIYAMCINDFLPTGAGEYLDRGYEIPLPAHFKEVLIENARSVAFISDLYDAALRNLGLRANFIQDIVSDFQGYQARFGRDIADMNRLIKEHGLPPLVFIAVNQFMYYGSDKHQIIRVAEALARNAGCAVISSEPYMRLYDNEAMTVSRWEGHPNEVANYIWARLIAEELRQREDLKYFQRRAEEFYGRTGYLEPRAPGLTGLR